MLFGSSGVDSDTAILDVAMSSVGEAPIVQAFVYISIGSMAKETMADYSIATLRTLGGWKGAVYILTDKPSCFVDTAKAYGVVPVKVPDRLSKSIMEIKSLKAMMFEYLPKEINSVIYLDVDIVLQKPVRHFLIDIGSSYKKMHGNFDIGAFPDAEGHYLGFCNGCEKWHSGVLLVRRNEGEGCLKAWGKIITSAEFSTDQESLDAAENRGHCKHLLTMPPSYLLFAKDYIAMALTSGHTFVHITAAGRLETQDYFYKNIIVPRLRGKSGEAAMILSKEKQCGTD